MKRTFILSAAVLALSVSTASAQGAKGLAGKWQLDAAKTKAANVAGFGEGMFMPNPVTLAFDGDVLTLSIDSPKGPRTTSYKLDGTEQPEGNGTVSAKREGAKVVLVTVRQTPAGQVRSITEYSQEGGALVVSTTAPPRGGGKPVTSKLIYNRAG
jgi:hypothetical protein